jgi:hypothetical protein
MKRKVLTVTLLASVVSCLTNALINCGYAQNTPSQTSAHVAASTAPPPIPIRFTLDKPGNVTLVIEDEKGNRVRNLVAATLFPAGKNVVWWDGRDESVRVPYVEGNTVGIHGIYKVGGRPVTPGKYRVRGLARDDIKLRYEFTVYPNSGNPPWRTADGTGAWLSDHTPPADTEFVPATGGLTTEPRVYISASIAEAGFGLIWTDLNGRKINGLRWIGGHWTGANYLARDAGTQTVPNVILYTGSGWSNDKDKTTPELRLNAITPNGAREVFKWIPKTDVTPKAPASTPAKATRAAVSGLAARNGLLVVAESTTEKILFIRVAPHPKKKNEFEGVLAAMASFKGARDLAFDGSGRLLVLTAQSLRRFVVPADLKENIELGAGEVLVGGLEDAQRLSLDGAGRVYVSDWGKSHQVKVFDAAGKLLRAVGSAGEPQVGPYQREHMNRPLGTTVLPDGTLWVAEDDFAPKRVSVWDASGKLVRDMIGPPPYGGGGWLDPQDKTRFYLFHGQGNQGGGMEFKLDWETGKAELSNIYLCNLGNADFARGFWGDGPDCPIIFNGQRYLTNAFSSSPTNGARVFALWRMEKGLATPVLLAGAPQALPQVLRDQLGDALPIDARPKPKGDTPFFFVWTDGNANGKMDNAEFRFAPLPSRMSSVTPTREGAIVATLSDRVLSFAPKWEKGAPFYDVAAPTTLAANFQMRASSGGGQSVIGKDGWVVVTNGPVEGFQNGQKKWYYHNQWPGLHAGHRAPAQAEYSGQLIAVTRLLGLPVTPRGGEAGEVWGVNSDRAVMYLTTTDGLFISQLGNLDPNKQWRSPEHKRGMDVSDVNFVGENFWPSLNQSSDGNIYLVTGKEHSSLVRVDGLDSIKRLPAQTIDVTPALLAQAEEYSRRVDEAEIAKTMREPLQVALRSEKMTVDGDFADWKDARWVVIDPGSGQGSRAQRKLPSVEGALAISGDNLLVALRSRTPDILRNEGQAPQELFKTGGGLDVMLQSNGDKRVLLALAPDGKKILAAIYQPIVPGAKLENRVPFSSPWRTITFDRVEDVAARVQLKVKTVSEKDADGEAMRVDQIEAAIPLSLLELSPKAGLKVRGDLGILRGAGGETMQRLYWSNKATGLMNDVPGEAQLTPGSWGEWEFVAAP